MINHVPISVLITGASGFVGASVLRRMNGLCDRIIAVLRQTPPAKSEISGVTYVQGDLLEKQTWQELERFEPEMVIHIAAETPSSFAEENASNAARINLIIDNNAILFAQKLQSRLVYASSTSVYGHTIMGRCSESTDCQPTNAYAAAKLRIEESILAPAELPSAAVLRLNAPYGPGQRIKTVIRHFIESALRNSPLLYHGSGSRSQDFTYIEDIAEAFMRATISNETGIFNIAAGTPINMRDLAALVLGCIPESTSEILPSGQPDPQEEIRTQFDVTRANEILGWVPALSLREGIIRYARHLRQQDDNRLFI